MSVVSKTWEWIPAKEIPGKLLGDPCGYRVVTVHDNGRRTVEFLGSVPAGAVHISKAVPELDKEKQ